MILKGSQRGGEMAMGRHLLKPENEHVEVHEVSGFITSDVLGAMKEVQAVAAGTRCKQPLFSVSLNPPETESVPVAAFEDAIDRIEKANSLEGQPRVVVFHEKEGRRHAHVLWSRIDAGTMTAKPLPFFKTRLREVSKQLYLDHGWRMPAGLMDSKARDPKNFDLAEWQQAKRSGRDPREVKGTIQECWAVSDDRASFVRAMEERGLYLAKGDRRGHVAVTFEGEVHSIARVVGKRLKEITARLGSTDDLRTVEDTRLHIARVVTPKLRSLMKSADQARTRDMVALNEKRQAMREKHHLDRQTLDHTQRERGEQEARKRSERLRPGVKGLWDRLTGERRRTLEQNEREALAAIQRDRKQRDGLIAAQLRDRQELQRGIRYVRHRHAARVLELHRDLAKQASAEREGLRPTAPFTRAAQAAERQPAREQPRHQRGRRDREKGLGL
jgi:hypothetical protein